MNAEGRGLEGRAGGVLERVWFWSGFGVDAMLTRDNVGVG
jgi:hypothetical protein